MPRGRCTHAGGGGEAFGAALVAEIDALGATAAALDAVEESEDGTATGGGGATLALDGVAATRATSTL